METAQENPTLEIFDNILADPQRGDHFKTDSLDVVVLGRKPDGEVMYHIREADEARIQAEEWPEDLNDQYGSARNNITLAERGNETLANKFMTPSGVTEWLSE